MVKVGLVAVDGTKMCCPPAGCQPWEEAHRRQFASAEDAQDRVG